MPHRYIALLTMALGLSGCASLVPSTLAHMASMSPLDTDPASIQVALGLPEGTSIAPGSARLILAATRRDTGETTQIEAPLLRIDPGQDPGLANLNAPGGVLGFRIDPAARAPLRAEQARIRQWDAEDGDATQGSLSVHMRPCATGAEPGDQVSVWIRLGTGAPFRPLVRRASVQAYVDTETLEPCGGPE